MIFMNHLINGTHCFFVTMHIVAIEMAIIRETKAHVIRAKRAQAFKAAHQILSESTASPNFFWNFGN